MRPNAPVGRESSTVRRHLYLVGASRRSTRASTLTRWASGNRHTHTSPSVVASRRRPARRRAPELFRRGALRRVASSTFRLVGGHTIAGEQTLLASRCTLVCILKAYCASGGRAPATAPRLTKPLGPESFSPARRSRRGRMGRAATPRAEDHSRRDAPLRQHAFVLAPTSPALPRRPTCGHPAREPRPEHDSTPLPSGSAGAPRLARRVGGALLRRQRTGANSGGRCEAERISGIAGDPQTSCGLLSAVRRFRPTRCCPPAPPPARRCTSSAR